MNPLSILRALLLLLCPTLLIAAGGNSRNSLEVAEIAYFLHSDADQISRYDLENQTWLDPIAIDESASCFVVADDFLFVAYGKILYRYALDGSDATHLGNFLHPILSLHTDGDLLFVNHSSSGYAYIDSYDQNTLGRLDSFTAYDPFNADAVIEPNLNEIYSVYGNERRFAIGYEDNGEFSTSLRSQYSGNATIGSKLFLWSGKSRQIGRRGWVYDSVTLETIGQLAEVDSLAFVEGELPIIVSSDQLLVYSKDLRETDRIQLQAANGNLFLHGQTASVFYPDSASDHGYTLQRIAFSELAIDDPSAPIDPAKFAFEPDEVFAASNGKLYLSYHKLSALFTWDIATQDWDSTIELDGLPSAIRYSSENELIYLAYPDGRINKIDPSASNPSESLIVDTESQINSLVAAGSFIYTSISGNSWYGIKIYDLSGEETGSVQHQIDTFDAVWATGRVVSNRGNYSTLYDFVVQESGATGTNGSKSFNDISVSGALFPHPGQQLVLTSSGVLYNPLEKDIDGVLPESVVGATWIDGQLFTLHRSALKTWNQPTYSEKSSLALQSPPYALSSTHDGKLALVTLPSNGKPRISILDTGFNIQSLDDIPDPELSFGQMNASALSVEWTPCPGAQNYLVERSISSEGPWQQVASLGFDSGTFADIDIAVGETYYYRVKATNGSLESAYSNVIAVDTSRDPSTGEISDPSQISRYVSSAVVDANDILYVTINSQKGIYRYDLQKQTWLEGIPTTYNPSNLYYSDARHSLFFNESDQGIMEVNLKGTPLVAVPFKNFSNYFSGNIRLATEDFVLLTNYSSHYLYDPLGNLLSENSVYPIDSNAIIVWDEAKRSYSWSESSRVYEVKVGPNGSIESSYKPIENNDRFIASNDDHSLFLSQSGNLYSANTFGKLYSLADHVESALWLGEELITIASASIQKRAPSTFEVTDSLPLEKDRRSLLPLSDGRFALLQGDYSSSPDIVVLDPDLKTSPPDTLAAPPSFRIQNAYSHQNVLQWNDIGGELGYQLERRTNAGKWEKIAELDKDSTSYTDPDITSGNTYSYRIRGINGDTPSSLSDTVAIPSDPPKAPTALKATKIGERTYRLEWQASENALYYQIRYSTNAGSSWNNHQSGLYLSEPEGALTISTNQIWLLRVRAVGSFGQTAVSESITLYEDLEKPAAPDSLVATPIDFLSVSLNWSETYRATGYLLERKQPDSSPEWTTIATLEASTRNYYDVPLEEDTRYQYRVSAINPSGTSAPKLSSTIVTPKRLPPQAPKLIAGQQGDDAVLLNWSNTSWDAEHRILRRLVEETEWTELEIEDPDSQSYLDTGLEIGSTYVYTAIASNPAGESPYAVRSIITIMPQQIVFQDDFTNGIDRASYNLIQGSIATDEDSDIGNYLKMESSYSSIMTLPLDLRNGGTLSFDLKFEGSPVSLSNNVLTIDLGVNNSQPRAASIEATQRLTNSWTRYSVNIPEGMSGTETYVILRHFQTYQYTNRFLFDNIVVSRAAPPIPLPPLTVAAKSAPDGGVSVFWTPSLYAKSYLVEVSTDQGESWQFAFLALENQTHYHEPSPYNEESIYRVIAANSTGQSEPTLSNAAASSVELADAVQMGIDKVIADPDTYQLYNATHLEEAREQGHLDVQNNPGGFGLYQQEFISNLYYRLSSEPVQIKGDLISFGWILYRSSDLIDWTEHPFTIEFENDPESEAEFIKIRPDTE
ncbi:fibronectin type III domain-containing protein [Pelagicoccus sp. SDUM812003]|uniref:fibronectin type III domain-containing protein n=1 Tax=Pelagicoccus sp. SDUM812003 TaxID=3041267 RepID=UPI00280F08D3|nr:fibronectin type III domain-containing protein [Pelagicoccus sp. SDUM812003]MDQ8204165.1 fibronectin type III domain-containing protein [Pelagicoccus sp. SDUM812003]